MESPFYEVKVKENELFITDLIDSFSFEDCATKDDYLKINIKTNDINLIDADWLAVGKILLFRFGYIAGIDSGERQAIIQAIKINYNALISIDVECLDKGSTMKKTQSNKVWKDRTASEIAEEISKEYGLEPQIEKTIFKYVSIPQGNKTDFQFLQMLANQEENGSFQCYIKDNILYFIKKNLGKNSKRTYIYGDNNGDIISFSVDYRDVTQDMSAGQVTAQSFNPLTQELTKIEANPLNAKENVNLGSVVNTKFDYDSNSKQSKNPNYQNVKSKNEAQKNITGKSMSAPSTMPVSTLDNLANSTHKNSKQKELIGTINLVGDASLKVDDILTIKGVGKKFSGNWYISQINHKISNSGFTTSIELQKNAVNKATSNNSTNALQINNTKGKEQKNEITKKQIQNYDVNSNKIK